MIRNFKINKYVLLLLLSISYSFIVAAQSSSVKVRPRPTNPIRAVNDFGEIISPTNEMQLELKLRKFYDSTSNELVIITLPSLDGFNVEEVANAYGVKWGVGNKQKDNGILLLVTLDEGNRKIRIETGRGIDAALPDGLAGSIIRRDIIPLLKEKKYYEAFDAGTTSIIKATRGEYQMDDPSDRRDSGKGGGSFMSIMLMLFVIFVILVIISKRGGGGNGGMLSRRGYRRWGGPTVVDYGPWMGGSSGGGIFGGGGSSGGGGLGDFGGFGGGDFGGGGASGDW